MRPDPADRVARVGHRVERGDGLEIRQPVLDRDRRQALGRVAPRPRVRPLRRSRVPAAPVEEHERRPRLEIARRRTEDVRLQLHAVDGLVGADCRQGVRPRRLRARAAGIRLTLMASVQTAAAIVSRVASAFLPVRPSIRYDDAAYGFRRTSLCRPRDRPPPRAQRGVTNGEDGVRSHCPGRRAKARRQIAAGTPKRAARGRA